MHCDITMRLKAVTREGSRFLYSVCDLTMQCYNGRHVPKAPFDNAVSWYHVEEKTLDRDRLCHEYMDSWNIGLRQSKFRLITNNMVSMLYIVYMTRAFR